MVLYYSTNWYSIVLRLSLYRDHCALPGWQRLADTVGAIFFERGESIDVSKESDDDGGVGPSGVVKEEKLDQVDE